MAKEVEEDEKEVSREYCRCRRCIDDLHARKAATTTKYFLAKAKENAKIGKVKISCRVLTSNIYITKT